MIYGDIGPTKFKCSVIAPAEKNEFVQVHHETCGMVLGRVDQIERKTDLSIEKAHLLAKGEHIPIEEMVSASIAIVGYRDERNLLQVPRTPFKAGEPVEKANEDLIRKVIGLKEDRKTGAYVGMLRGHDVAIYLDINGMIQKHVSILAKTGGGKSYMAGVVMEEFLKHKVTTVVIDPHGEYSSLGTRAKSVPLGEKFRVVPNSYESKLMIFSPDTKINQNARPLKFTLSNLQPRDILSLTKSGRVRNHLTALREALDLIRSSRKDYDVDDIIRVLEAQDDPSNFPLMNELEYLREVDIFAREGTKIDELVKEGWTTIINMKGTPPDIQQLVINRISTALFELRKVEKIPPLMLVAEEAHNFCPQQGKAATSDIFRTIASEGRKFGLGLMIITQRAAKVDKNVLSQCNTQIILKVTNPNDLKTIMASVEGLTAGMADEIQMLPVGVSLITGGNISMPLLIDVRPRETEHGGKSVKILE
ncbi:MAG: ATP-binding protein [Thermoplasmata archaeon]|nr:ATP-binding protein [Thermoplasmata archaeon]